MSSWHHKETIISYYLVQILFSQDCEKNNRVKVLPTLNIRVIFRDISRWTKTSRVPSRHFGPRHDFETAPASDCTGRRVFDSCAEIVAHDDGRPRAFYIQTSPLLVTVRKEIGVGFWTICFDWRSVCCCVDLCPRIL